MRVNPRTDQPAILAIGLPDEDGDFDNASLYLFERQADGQWNREVVWQDQPIIDADFDFRPGGPQVAAATEHPDEALNADLHFLARFADRPAWDARPLTWNLAGFPADTSLGMWLRFVVSEWWDSEERSRVTPSTARSRISPTTRCTGSPARRARSGAGT